MLYALVYILIILIIVFILDQCRPRNFMKLHKQLGTDWACIPLIGHAYKCFGNNVDLFNNFADLSTETYKRKSGLVSFWIGNKFGIVIGDPIQAVTFLKNAFDKTWVHTQAKYLFGNGQLFAPGHIWHRRRKITAPIFAPRHIKKLVTVFQEHARVLNKKIEENVGQGNVSCWYFINNTTLSSICETILDVKIKETKNRQENQFFKALDECMKIGGDCLTKPWLFIFYRYFSARLLYAKNTIVNFVSNIVDSKKARIKSISSTLETDKKNEQSLLELMIRSAEKNGKDYSDLELHEDLRSIILAASHTSAIAICSILLLLSQHEDVQEKVFKEVKDVLGDLNSTINYEDLKKLRYLRSVIKESLRLYPPVPVINRDSQEDVKLPFGITIPKTCPVFVSIYGIHRNQKYWGADANEFKPERFLSNVNGTVGAFMPFSNGPRNCPGQLYAMLSMKTILVHIVRQYRLLPATSFKYDENNPLRVAFEIIATHADNYELQIEYRDQKEKVKEKVT